MPLDAAVLRRLAPQDVGEMPLTVHAPSIAHGHDGGVNSPAHDSFYVRLGDRQVLARPTTASPWGPHAQHGGPPTALLARAIQRLDGGAERVMGRLTVELLGPVPVGRLSV